MQLWFDAARPKSVTHIVRDAVEALIATDLGGEGNVRAAAATMGERVVTAIQRQLPRRVLEHPASYRAQVQVAIGSLVHEYTCARARRGDLDPTFIAMAKEPVLQEMMREYPSMLHGEALTPQESLGAHMKFLTECWLLVQWERAHKPVYSQSAGLAQQLLWTEVRGLRVSDVQLPHPAVLLMAPDVPELARYSEVFVSVLDLSEHMPESDGPVLQFVAPHRQDALSTAVWYLPLDDIPIEEALTEWTSGERAMQEAWPKVGTGLPWHKPQPTDLGTGRSQADSQLRELTHWALNTLLYVTSRDVRQDVAWSDPERQRIFQKMQQATSKTRPRRRRELADYDARSMARQYRVVRLGSDVEYQKGTGSSVSVRTLVAGHWRNQACGTKRQERKRIWIKPHWRGPDGAPISPNVYRVEA